MIWDAMESTTYVQMESWLSVSPDQEHCLGIVSFFCFFCAGSTGGRFWGLGGAPLPEERWYYLFDDGLVCSEVTNSASEQVRSRSHVRPQASVLVSCAARTVVFDIHDKGMNLSRKARKWHDTCCRLASSQPTTTKAASLW